jgi:hypothetical protein
MSERFKGTGSGKGDKSRISDINKFSRNMEKLYEKKGWRFWAVWDGYDLKTIKFDETGLKEGESITYKDFKKRLGLIKND